MEFLSYFSVLTCMIFRFYFLISKKKDFVLIILLTLTLSSLVCWWGSKFTYYIFVVHLPTFILDGKWVSCLVSHQHCSLMLVSIPEKTLVVHVHAYVYFFGRGMKKAHTHEVPKTCRWSLPLICGLLWYFRIVSYRFWSFLWG